MFLVLTTCVCEFPNMWWWTRYNAFLINLCFFFHRVVGKQLSCMLMKYDFSSMEEILNVGFKRWSHCKDLLCTVVWGVVCSSCCRSATRHWAFQVSKGERNFEFCEQKMVIHVSWHFWALIHRCYEPAVYYSWEMQPANISFLWLLHDPEGHPHLSRVICTN